MIGAIGVLRSAERCLRKAAISGGTSRTRRQSRLFEQVRSPLTRLFKVHDGEIEMNERVRVEMFPFQSDRAPCEP
jgi:hypothetical protein